MLPTPLRIIEYLKSQGHELKNEAGQIINYAPWGYTPNQISRLTEGPLGYECLETSSNLTDSVPRTWMPWNPPRNITVKLEKPAKEWFSFKVGTSNSVHDQPK